MTACSAARGWTVIGGCGLQPAALCWHRLRGCVFLPGCVGQLPVERIECDAALEWWFSPEAVEKEKEYRDDLKIKEFRLPGECEAISR